MNVPNLALYLLQDPSFVTVEKKTPLGDLELIWIIFSHWLQKEMLLLQEKIMVLYNGVYMQFAAMLTH